MILLQTYETKKDYEIILNNSNKGAQQKLQPLSTHYIL